MGKCIPLSAYFHLDIHLKIPVKPDYRLSGTVLQFFEYHAKLNIF